MEARGSVIHSLRTTSYGPKENRLPGKHSVVFHSYYTQSQVSPSSQYVSSGKISSYFKSLWIRKEGIWQFSVPHNLFTRSACECPQICPKRAIRTTSDLCSGSVQFEPRPGHSRLWGFSWFFFSHSMEMLEMSQIRPQPITSMSFPINYSLLLNNSMLYSLNLDRKEKLTEPKCLFLSAAFTWKRKGR